MSTDSNHRPAAEIIREHRDVFEAIVDLADDHPEFAERFGAAPLRYADAEADDE